MFAVACCSGPFAIATGPQEHWAFRPPVRPPLPVSTGAEHPVDVFVREALRKKGLAPSPEADRATLLRRLSLDLTGLPPTVEQQDEFLNDRRPDAYERLVERLLASPAYGERWGQHWLDLARYADTDGYEFDAVRPDAWRYRDWLVRALNADMPYDRFIRLQVAGDELESGDADAWIATGFNRCYPDMVDANDQALRRQNALNDITETTGLVFLGLTLGCARCHDHKFDPVSIGDFYRLQAVFTPAKFRDDLPVGTEADRAAREPAMLAWREKLTKTQRALLKLERPVREKLAPGIAAGTPDEVVSALGRPEAEWTDQEVGSVFDALEKDPRIGVAAIAAELRRASPGPGESDVHAGLRRTLDDLKRNPPPPLPTARGLVDAGPRPPATFVLKRGDLTARGAQVEPGVPKVLESAPLRIQPKDRSTGRRAALAAWLTGRDNPLTARVVVNRLWQGHFGRGIVATTSDFGLVGSEPTHPSLLDWLACELMDRGWSLKAMHRLIVTSRTYRRSSIGSPESRRLDPDAAELSRFPRRRLDGETIRDALLAVSGRLDRAMGGPGVFPELPPELAALNSRGLWPISPRESDRRRRSLYIFVRRNLRYPFFEAFDRPDTNASCPQRPTTTIAPQALSLLNSGLAFDAARALADRVRSESRGDTDAGIRRAYRLALGRVPEADELADARRFVSEGDAAWPAFCLALVNSNAFVYLD